VSLRQPAVTRLLAVLLATAVVIGWSPTSTGSSVARADGTIQITGHGYGHGRGMGQWGSYGYATIHGWNWIQILRHYYGGTSLGNQPNTPITVQLTWLDGRDLVVTSGADFTVGGVLVSGGHAARLQARTDGTFLLSTRYSCEGGDVWSTVVPTSRVQSTVGDPGNNLSHMLSACTGGEGRQYRGELSLTTSGGSHRTINTVYMEDYLRGVVPRESPAAWGDAAGGRGIEALRAQAVAARSYAYAENRSVAKTCDTTACQVYAGAGRAGVSQEDPRTDAAIATTATSVLRGGNGAIVRTEFSSSTGGWSAGGQFPAVRDDGDVASPYNRWTQGVAGSTIAAAFGVGSFVSATVTARNGLGADGGRVTRVRVVGSAGAVDVTGNEFRTALGLRSDWFSLSTPPPTQPVVYQRNSTDGGPATAVYYGDRGDRPLSCDWNGDGTQTLGVYRAGVFHLSNDPAGGSGSAVFRYGAAGDQPICGDWDGDGVDTIGVFRNGVVYLRNTNDAGVAHGAFAFGAPGDVAVAGNWNGDPYDSIGIYRGSTFQLADSNIHPVVTHRLPFGDHGDLPAVGDWDGDGTDGVGVFRSGTYFLKNVPVPGASDVVVGFGDRGDRPVPGDWDGDGRVTLGVARGY
jgi:SpoIID/LytB domain protein